MTATKTNIILPCPCCGNAEAGINVRLHCIAEPDEQFECAECEECFGANQIHDFIAKWTKILAWVDAAPTIDEETE